MFIIVITCCPCCAAAAHSYTGDDDVTDYYKPPVPDSLQRQYATKYDFSDFVGKLTTDCRTDYEKLKAIYRWICANIDYDTNYQIHTADSCVEARKGVCQGYCELFYQLAKSAGVRTEIVFGSAKDKDGIVSVDSHAWIFAYTRTDRGILIDPTWGAGTVDNGVFHRRKNCMIWFDVSPEWMVMSHLPKDTTYQLLSEPLDSAQFQAIPPSDALWMEYGLDAHDIFTKARQGTLSLPSFFINGEGEFKLIDFPQSNTLSIGQNYTFRIRVTSGREFALINNSIYCRPPEWKSEGDGIFSVDYMPRDTGNLSIGLKNRERNYWDNMIKYRIETPTPDNWKVVEARFPLAMPEMRNVKHLYPDAWAKAGIDAHTLLALVRKHCVSELPILYSDRGQSLKIRSVPMSKKLKASQSHIFQFYPGNGQQWMVVNNDNRYTNWEKGTDGLLSMTLGSLEKGSLILYVQMEPAKPYVACLEYEVE